MSTEKQTRDGKPYRWPSPDGVMHAAEGAELAPPDRRTFVLWTVCGKYDVPANSAFASYEAGTCPHCVAAESPR